MRNLTVQSLRDWAWDRYCPTVAELAEFAGLPVESVAKVVLGRHEAGELGGVYWSDIEPSHEVAHEDILPVLVALAGATTGQPNTPGDTQ